MSCLWREEFRLRVFRALIVVTGLMLITATSHASSGNDAGTGADASGDPLSPTVLPAYGTYHAVLKAPDEDWYKGPSVNGTVLCADLSAIPDVAATFELRAGNHRVGTDLLAATTGKLALASIGPTAATAGFVSGTDSGGYDFTLRLLTRADLGSGDGNSGTDAGDTLNSAHPLKAGCTGGALASVLNDPTDVYSFSGVAGQQIVYSLAASAPIVDLKILDSLGTIIGSAIASGGIASVTLPSTDTYYVVAGTSESKSTDYVIGIVGPEPPVTPCRPTCFYS